MIKAKTIAQYRILKWIEHENYLCLDAFKARFVAGDRLRITDIYGKSVDIVCEDDRVYLEEK